MSESLSELRNQNVIILLKWLEEANEFINKTLGLKKRARFDPRFKVFLKKSRK